jgi:hypothetical protein
MAEVHVDKLLVIIGKQTLEINLLQEEITKRDEQIQILTKENEQMAQSNAIQIPSGILKYATENDQLRNLTPAPPCNECGDSIVSLSDAAQEVDMPMVGVTIPPDAS